MQSWSTFESKRSEDGRTVEHELGSDALVQKPGSTYQDSIFSTSGPDASFFLERQKTRSAKKRTAQKTSKKNLTEQDVKDFIGDASHAWEAQLQGVGGRTARGTALPGKEKQPARRSKRKARSSASSASSASTHRKKRVRARGGRAAVGARGTQKKKRS